MLSRGRRTPVVCLSYAKAEGRKQVYENILGTEADVCRRTSNSLFDNIHGPLLRETAKEKIPGGAVVRDSHRMQPRFSAAFLLIRGRSNWFAASAFVRFTKAIAQKIEEAAEACEDRLWRVGRGFPLLKARWSK